MRHRAGRRRSRVAGLAVAARRGQLPRLAVTLRGFCLAARREESTSRHEDLWVPTESSETSRDIQGHAGPAIACLKSPNVRHSMLKSRTLGI